MTPRGISAALDRLDDDPHLRAGVLTGTATVFSAGTDLRDGADAVTERGGEYGLIRRRRVKPLIAAVEGVAYGGGFEIALACDLIVASESARFALPESRRGVLATSGALFRAVRALPLHVAKGTAVHWRRPRRCPCALVRAGEPAHPTRRRARGGVGTGAGRVRVVAGEQTLAAIAEQVEEDARGWAATARALSFVMGSADMQEGVVAFLERREPRWPGR
ncbi:MAG: caiD6 [Rhizobacter sp.]|nr:caiD6 [Rhizobacter sp.]